VKTFVVAFSENLAVSVLRVSFVVMDVPMCCRSRSTTTIR